MLPAGPGTPRSGQNTWCHLRLHVTDTSAVSAFVLHLSLPLGKCGGGSCRAIKRAGAESAESAVGARQSRSTKGKRNLGDLSGPASSAPPTSRSSERAVRDVPSVRLSTYAHINHRSHPLRLGCLLETLDERRARRGATHIGRPFALWLRSMRHCRAPPSLIRPPSERSTASSNTALFGQAGCASQCR